MIDVVAHYGEPAMTWLVAALLVQRERQRWHHAIARTLDEGDDSDAVPGLPGWTADFHGSGLLLVGPDGEALDADFNDETGAIIDVWFFAARVQSVRHAAGWLAERRLWRWRPSRAMIVDGCEQLVALGAASCANGYGNQIVLADELDVHAADVAAALGADAASWLAALEPGGEAAHVAAHRVWLRALVRDSARGADFLAAALAGADGDEAGTLARPLIARGGAAAAQAIALLRTRPQDPVLPEVAALLRAASLTDDHPYAPLEACGYLLERGVEPALARARFDAWSQLRVASGYRGNPMQSRFAILALQRLPERALALVRASLRSTTPACAAEIAALLTAIDQPWCRRELAAARAEVGEPPQLFTPEAALVAELRGRYPDDWAG